MLPLPFKSQGQCQCENQTYFLLNKVSYKMTMYNIYMFICHTKTNGCVYNLAKTCK